MGDSGTTSPAPVESHTFVRRELFTRSALFLDQIDNSAGHRTLMRWSARTDSAAAGIQKSTSASGLTALSNASTWAELASQKTSSIATEESAPESTFAHRINDAAWTARLIHVRMKMSSGQQMTESAFLQRASAFSTRSAVPRSSEMEVSSA